eukprot:gene4851-6799_t
MKSNFMFEVLIFVVISIQNISACTTIAVGKKATIDGSVMATHSNDAGGLMDPRLVKIPANDYPSGTLRPIYASPENYPRYVGKERNAAIYLPENCQAGNAACVEFKPIGYIPQVNHTYSYFEATYAIMNEMQVSMGESTCSSVFVAKSVNAGGKALLSIDQLTQIALERSKTAKEAVQIMGSLGEQYGFYGESDSFEGGAESLMVIDPNEAWVFHILADPSGSSAIWVGARVPDDSVAVVANMFSIREVDLSDSANFLGRSDMWDIALEHGLYKLGDPKDFTATFSDGEYAHKYYSGRRMWSIFNTISPSSNFPAEYGNLKTDKPYPFAVSVEKPLTSQDVFALMRSWYQGTPYSTSQGLASGSFGTPDRFSNSAEDYQVTGNWERTIGLYRTSDTFIVQARSWLPNAIGGVTWFGPSAAHYTSFVPILAGMLRAPDCLEWGWPGVYNLTTSYWAHRSVLNLAQVKFSFMINDIQTAQNKLESDSIKLVNDLTDSFVRYGYIQKSLHLRNNKKIDTDINDVNGLILSELSNEYLEKITDELIINAKKSVVAFHDLFHSMIFKYADGQLNYWSDDKFHSTSLGYPVWWLEQVGYEDGPEPINHSKSKLSKYFADRYKQSLINQNNQQKDVRTISHELALKSQEPLLSSNEKWNKMNISNCISSCNTLEIENDYKICVKTCII